MFVLLVTGHHLGQDRLQYRACQRSGGEGTTAAAEGTEVSEKEPENAHRCYSDVCYNITHHNISSCEELALVCV